MDIAIQKQGQWLDVFRSLDQSATDTILCLNGDKSMIKCVPFDKQCCVHAGKRQTQSDCYHAYTQLETN